MSVLHSGALSSELWSQGAASFPQQPCAVSRCVPRGRVGSPAVPRLSLRAAAQQRIRPTLAKHALE